VPWFRLSIAGLSPRRPGFDPGSVHVGFTLGKVALGQVFPRVLRFVLVNFNLPVLQYKKKPETLITFIICLHNKPQGCGASVASAARPFTTKKKPPWVPYISVGRRLLFDYISGLSFATLGEMKGKESPRAHSQTKCVILHKRGSDWPLLRTIISGLDYAIV
jgi:hypothetical protein